MEGKRKCKRVIVRHVPLTRIVHLFFKHGGQFSVQITGKRRNKGIGLKIPALLQEGVKNTKTERTIK